MRFVLILTFCLSCSLTGCITSKLNDRALHPSSTYEMVPEDMGLDYELLAVPSDDAVIHAWFLPADEPSGNTVIVCGGNSGNKGLYVPLARELTRAGYHTVLVDYRGFGFSTGEPDLWSLVDDTMAVIEAVSARPDTDRVALFGMSLGSVVALGAASREESGVVGVISECSLHPSEALSDEVGGFLATVFGGLVTPSSWDVEEIAAEMPVPVFFIHGTEDSITELERAQLIFTAAEDAPAARYVWIVPGVGHSPEFAGLYGPEYVDRIVTFFDAVMKGQGDLAHLTEPREPGPYRRARALFEASRRNLYPLLGKGSLFHMGGMIVTFDWGGDEEQSPEESLADCREVEARLRRETWNDSLVAPCYARLWRTLGERYEELGFGEDALRAYRVYIDLIPENPNAWFYFTDAGWEIGWSLPEVASSLQRMAALAPTEEERLRYISEAVDWLERGKRRSEFMLDWQVKQRAAVMDYPAR